MRVCDVAQMQALTNLGDDCKQLCPVLEALGQRAQLLRHLAAALAGLLIHLHQHPGARVLVRVQEQQVDHHLAVVSISHSQRHLVPCPGDRLELLGGAGIL